VAVLDLEVDHAADHGVKGEDVLAGEVARVLRGDQPTEGKLRDGSDLGGLGLCYGVCPGHGGRGPCVGSGGILR
jgi:hypothetical protein